MRIPLVLVVVPVVAGSVSGCGHGMGASSPTLYTTMTAKAVVTPAGKPQPVPTELAHAFGTFTGTIGPGEKSLSWKLRFGGLGRFRLVVTDIHVGKEGEFGRLLVRLCGPCKSGQTGVAKLKADDAEALKGDNWVTVVTDRYPNGAVRGQIHVR